MGEPPAPPNSEASDAELATAGSPATDPSESDPEATETDAPDATLGGYLSVHDRPPAFEGSDGQPYTVSIEIETVANLLAPYVAYLVFPRWAETGLGIVGHVETPVLYEGKGQDEVRGRAEALSLGDVKRLLDSAILERHRPE